MKIEFNQKIKNEIQKISENKINEESCGLIIFDKNNLEFKVVECSNLSRDKKNFFSISPFDYIKCSKLGKIIACFHSHCNKNEEFSEIDILNSNKYNITYILYNIINKNFNIYYPNTKKTNYIGRPYIIEQSDCFSLVKEYYKKEINVDICYPKDKIYPKNIKDINDLYEMHLEGQGFVKLDKNTELKKHDGILMLFPNISEEYPTHGAMYIGNNTILHHPYNSFSCVNIYDNFYKKHTKYIVRHRSLL